MLYTLRRWLNRTIPRLGIAAIGIALIVGIFQTQSSTLATPSNNDRAINPGLEQQVLNIIRRNPSIIREALQVEEQQKQQKQEAVKQQFQQEIQKNPASVIGHSPTKGAPNQKRLLIEFADFQCPYCAEAHKILKQFMEHHQGQVTLVYKHYPLTSIHPEAIAAAKAAWAAQQQGKFWQYHDLLFERQSELGEKLYLELAQQLGLDLTQFNQHRNSPEFAKVLDQDQQMADTLGIQGTPFFFINGETLSGAVPLPNLEQLVLAKAP